MANNIICSIERLPTESNSKITEKLSNNKLYYSKHDYFNQELVNENQHLYFLCEEKIKVGDIVIDEDRFIGEIISITELYGYRTKLFTGSEAHYFPDQPNEEKIYKIIASTDKSLNLPLIPDSFIEEYCLVNRDTINIKFNQVIVESEPIIENNELTIKIINQKIKIKMENILPLTPNEILENREIDYKIIGAINTILKNKFIGNPIDITLKEIKIKMTELYGLIDFDDLFNRKQFDFEDYYRKFGWDVRYDKPGYSETYNSFYTFKPSKK